jgi:hypothetical protein
MDDKANPFFRYSRYNLSVDIDLDYNRLMSAAGSWTKPNAAPCCKGPLAELGWVLPLLQGSWDQFEHVITAITPARLQPRFRGLGLKISQVVPILEFISGHKYRS